MTSFKTAHAVTDRSEDRTTIVVRDDFATDSATSGQPFIAEFEETPIKLRSLAFKIVAWLTGSSLVPVRPWRWNGGF
jgi:hypothetical protein